MVRLSTDSLATLLTRNLTGSFQYSHAAGKSSVEDGAADIQDDAVFLLASQTKLLTAVAALQVVERGLIGFDDDVAELLPELAKQPVLTGFDEEDKPVLEERKNAITFRYVRATG
jgi:CubicO group peptidase (beta-lactamase class C family)